MQVKKWGNSAPVRIAASIMVATSLNLDQEVDVREEEGRIVIEPVRTQSYDLNVLLQQMTPDTFPEPIDFGSPVRSEIW